MFIKTRMIPSRIKIFKRTETDDKVCPWDADVFFRIQEKDETYSHDAGDYYTGLTACYYQLDRLVDSD